MKTSLLILAIGAAAAVITVVVSTKNKGEPGIADPDHDKRTLVRFVSRYPGLASFIRRRLDRNRAGGLLLTIGFVGVFLVALWIGALFDMIDEAMSGMQLTVPVTSRSA